MSECGCFTSVLHLKEGSGFLPSERVLGCAIKPCAIKAGTIKAGSGSCYQRWWRLCPRWLKVVLKWVVGSAEGSRACSEPERNLCYIGETSKLVYARGAVVLCRWVVTLADRKRNAPASPLSPRRQRLRHQLLTQDSRFFPMVRLCWVLAESCAHCCCFQSQLPEQRHLPVRRA